MADNSETPAPAKAAARKTMAPAARRPGGADETSVDEYAASLERLSEKELDNLERALRDARTRRVRHPQQPSFGLSEGERQELEQNGSTTSPWTGRRIEGDGSSNERPEPADNK